MKKKILFFSLVLLMSVSLCACKGGADDVENSENKIEMTSDGQPIVTQKMLAQYIQKVEITEDQKKEIKDHFLHFLYYHLTQKQTYLYSS